VNCGCGNALESAAAAEDVPSTECARLSPPLLRCCVSPEAAFFVMAFFSAAFFFVAFFVFFVMTR